MTCPSQCLPGSLLAQSSILWGIPCNVCLALVDGVPPRLQLTQDDLQFELDRRRPGQSRQG